MKSFKGKSNSTPFYEPIYEQALAHLKAGEPVEFDDRGINISRYVRLMVGEIDCRKALDLGCGLGEVAVSLSSRCKTIVAADISKNALKVMIEVVKGNNINNINPVLLDAAHLPFKDSIFDLIICSGVLEWVPMNYSSDISPDRVQLNMLKEVKRVLSWLGLFWLGIENRYDLHHLVGSIDHHSGLRFIAFLPRFIANYYSKLVKKQPYRNYLYSYWELRKILQKEGFTVKKFLTAFPGYWNPKKVADLSSPNEISRVASLPRLKLSRLSTSVIKVISTLHLAKLLINDFIVLCTKRNKLKAPSNRESF